MHKLRTPPEHVQGFLMTHSIGAHQGHPVTQQVHRSAVGAS